MSLLRYILIDAADRTLSEGHAALDYETMLRIIGCSQLEVIRLPDGSFAWFDGSEVPYDVPVDIIDIGGVEVFGSRCLVTGPLHPATEENTSCQSTIEQMRQRIKWRPRVKITGETFEGTPNGCRIAYVMEPAEA